MTDWENYDTCPDGFCRHWSCNSDCELRCAKCGVRCPRHDDTAHEYVEGGA